MIKQLKKHCAAVTLILCASSLTSLSLQASSVNLQNITKTKDTNMWISKIMSQDDIRTGA